ncbi:UVR8, partial [Symbiodinium sp. CCMP2592]
MGVQEMRSSEIGLKAGMPPHLVQLIERIRKQGAVATERRASTGGFYNASFFSWQSIRKKAVRTKALRYIGGIYEYVVDVLVLAYALTLGFEVHYTSRDKEQPGWVYPVEMAFCIIFGLDIVLRLVV